MTQIDNTSPPDPTHTDDVAALEHIVRLCKHGQDAHIGLVPALNPTYGVDGTSVQHTALRLALALYHQHLPRLTIPVKPIRAIQIIQPIDSPRVEFRFNERVRGEPVWYQRHKDGGWAYQWKLAGASHLTVFLGADDTSLVFGNRREQMVATAGTRRTGSRLTAIIDRTCKLQVLELAEIKKRMGDDYARSVAVAGALAHATNVDPDRFPFDAYKELRSLADSLEDGISVRQAARGPQPRGPLESLDELGPDMRDAEAETALDTALYEHTSRTGPEPALLQQLTKGQREALRIATEAGHANMDLKAYLPEHYPDLAYDAVKKQAQRGRKMLDGLLTPEKIAEIIAGQPI